MFDVTLATDAMDWDTLSRLAVEALQRHAWQVTFVICVVAALSVSVFRRRRHLGYALWILVLLKCLAPPVWSSSMGLFSWAGHEEQVVEVDLQPAYSFSPAPMAEREWRFPEQETNPSSPPESAPVDADQVSRPVAAPIRAIAIPPDSAPKVRPIPAENRLIGLWCCGIVICAVWVVYRHVALHRIIRRIARPCDDQRLLDLFDRAARQAGVKSDVRLLVSPTDLGPAAFGVVRPRVILPELLAHDASDRELELIFGHELIHTRRRDTLHSLLQSVVQCLWWFHPLVWWSNRQIVRQREKCCDEELVAAFCSDPAEYAECLVNVLRSRRGPSVFPVMAGLGPLEMTRQRLEMIMSFDNRLNRRPPRRYGIVMLLLAACVLPGAALVTATEQDARVDPGQPEQLRIVDSQSSASMAAASFTEISPDGRSLYVTSWQNGGITVFDRNHETGKLSQRDVLSLPELNGLTDLRISSDGRIAVGACLFAQTAVLFERHPVSGRLSVLDIVGTPEDGDENFDGFVFPVDVALSPDGRFAYIADARQEGRSIDHVEATDIGAVIVFEITDDGKLKPVQTFEGPDRCLDGARAIVSHPDGRTLFVTSRIAETLTVLNRDSTSGHLSLRQVISREQDDLDVLHGVMTAAVSPDGQHVYTVSGRFTSPEPPLNFNQLLFNDLDSVNADLFGLNITTLDVNNDGDLDVYIAGKTETGGKVVGTTLADWGKKTEGSLRKPAEGVAIDAEALEGFLVAGQVEIASGDAANAFPESTEPQGIGVFRLTSDGTLVTVQTIRFGGPNEIRLSGGNQLLATSDGTRVYVSGTNSGTLASFHRNARTGELTLEQLLQSDSEKRQSLRGANGLAESADGQFLYVTGEFANSVTTLQRSRGNPPDSGNGGGEDSADE